MAHKNPPRAVAGKPYRITYGVRQRDILDEAANKLNVTPRQFMIDATLEACENARKVPTVNE